MEKICLFAFNGDSACFAHVMLNALDMKRRGYEPKIIIEGTATKQIKELGEGGGKFTKLYEQIKSEGLIDCVCKACAIMNGVADTVEQQGLSFCDEMSGHPSIARYLEKGFTVLTF